MQVNRGSGYTISNVTFPNGNVQLSGALIVTSSGNVSYSTNGGGAAGGNVVSSGSNTAVCYNGYWGFFGTCTSLRKFKTDIKALPIGLDIVLKLHPVSFKWKATGEEDLGFVAEEVESLDPLLAEYNKHKLSGVKYGPITSLLTKAVQEFHAQTTADSDDLHHQIDTLRADNDNEAAEIKELRAEIEQLKAAHH
jgi:endosialidase-like protein